MSKQINFHIFPIVFCSLLVACGNQPEFIVFSEEEVAEIDHMQNPFDKPIQWLLVEGTSRDIPYGAQNCKIYKGTQSKSGIIVDWSVVLDADYDIEMICDEISITKLDEYLVFSVTTKHYYNGVGNHRDFRTKNGVTWDTRQKTFHSDRIAEGEWIKYSP